MVSTSELGSYLRSLEISFDPDDLEEGNHEAIDTSKVVFPSLKKFHIACQPIRSVKFLAAHFPMLEELTIEQPNNHPKKFDLDLPNLTSLHFEHIYFADARKFGTSLSKCPKLESFCSYKLWGLGCLREHLIVAPKLLDWEMQRSDDLEGIVFWAPLLKGIRLRSCYALRTVHMMEKLPAGDWGPDYQFSGEHSTYDVSFYCVDLPGCRGNLLKNKRCGEVSDDMDDFQMF
jgi:hypothetical protein